MNFKKAVKKHNNKNHSKFNTNFNINQPSSKRHGPHICLRFIFCNIFWLALISNQYFWNHNPTSLQAGFLLIGKEWKNLFKFKRKWKNNNYLNTLSTLQKWKKKKVKKEASSRKCQKICAALFIIIISNQKDWLKTLRVFRFRFSQTRCIEKITNWQKNTPT